MDERVAFLKQRYPYAHVTIYKQFKLYHEKKIRLKKVQPEKMILNKQLPNIYQDVIELVDDVKSALLQGFRIVQIDEMMVTKRTFPTHDWSKLHTNTSFDLSKVDAKAIAVIGAVSRERGMELAMTFPRSINIVRFKIFLQQLRDKYPFDNLLLMMDNLGVHKSNQAR